MLHASSGFLILVASFHTALGWIAVIARHRRHRKNKHKVPHPCCHPNARSVRRGPRLPPQRTKRAPGTPAATPTHEACAGDPGSRADERARSLTGIRDDESRGSPRSRGNKCFSALRSPVSPYKVEKLARKYLSLIASRRHLGHSD